MKVLEELNGMAAKRDSEAIERAPEAAERELRALYKSHSEKIQLKKSSIYV